MELGKCWVLDELSGGCEIVGSSRSMYRWGSVGFLLKYVEVGRLGSRRSMWRWGSVGFLLKTELCGGVKCWVLAEVCEGVEVVGPR